MIDVTAIFRRKQEAQATLDDPGMQYAFAQVHQAAMQAIINSKPGEAALREEAYHTIHNLQMLERALAAAVASYTLAQERERKATRS